jgi:Ca2+-transporting ATPase
MKEKKDLLYTIKMLNIPVEKYYHHAIEIDGKASIEHQIEIYIHDLFDVKDNTVVSLEETLEGLHYLMDLRIKGHQQPNLDIGLMERLMKGILLNTGRTEGHLIRKKSTSEADMAFYLFGGFLEEVVEFRTVVNQMPIFELRDRLKIHYRCQPYSTETQKRGAIAMVQLLLSYFPQCDDWRDLIKQGEEDDMKKLMESPLAKQVQEERSKMPGQNISTTNLALLPPPALYFDRSFEKLRKMYPNSKADTGLPSSAIQSLHDHYGYNTLPDPPKPSPFKMLWDQLTDFMVVILILAAVVEAAEKDFNSMAVLLAVIVLNTIIGFSQEWKASKTLNALMNLSVPKVKNNRYNNRYRDSRFFFKFLFNNEL